MLKYSVLCVALLCMLLTTIGSAVAEAGYSQNVFGIHGGVGLGGSARSEDIDGVDVKPRLTGVGELHFNHFFNRIVGLNIGAGIISKGYLAQFDEGMVVVNGVLGNVAAHDSWYKSVHAVVPLGMIFNIGPLRLGIDVVFNYALSARIVDEIDGSRKNRYLEDEWWDEYRRFNFGPRVTAGIRIPVSTSGALVAAAFFETGVLNNKKKSDDSALDDTNDSERFWNLMATVGYEFGL
ncbi:MAG: hypothetical protein JXX14_25665 [Deltaproteobacteria bacterium]|nr:hypothetical protein [Deltaproteobacteria bacterium]